MLSLKLCSQSPLLSIPSAVSQLAPYHAIATLCRHQSAPITSCPSRGGCPSPAPIIAYGTASQTGGMDTHSALPCQDEACGVGQAELQKPTADPSRGQADGQEQAHPVIDDFIRTFLLRMGMDRTLDSFDTEWCASLLQTPHQ